MIEIVFFDAGETLLRPYPSFPVLFERTLRAHGIDVDAADVEPILYGRVRDLVAVAREAGVTNPTLSEDASHAMWTHLYRRCLDDLGVRRDGLADELYAVFSSSSSYRLFDDALPTLRRLASERYRLGLVSNFEGWLEEMLVEMEVGHLFDVTVISGLEGVEKPDVRIFELAVERAGIDPGAGVHVGDLPAMDVEPARAAGLNAVLIDRHGRHPDADCPTISSLEELPGLLPNL